MTERARALALLAGVLGVTSTWALAGLLTPGFDPVRQSISQLQRDGTDTAPVVTAALVGFAVTALLFVRPLARLAGPAPAAALLVAGLATLGAAASPLAEVRGGRQDALHLAAGATGYTALSVLPLLAALRWRGRARALSLLAGAVAVACLAGTVPADGVSGALQRAGFLAGCLWLAGVAVAVLRRVAPWRSRSASPDAAAAG